MTDAYRKHRREYPFMSAQTALRWAKTEDASEGWEASRRDNEWTREVEGFTITLRTDEESIFPLPNRHGDTDYGRYVDETRYEDYDWRGNFPRPSENAPLGLPYTSIRYDGPGWVQGERGGYFIPEGVEEQYDYFRRSGQSKSVAWDLTKEWVEAQISMLFHSPLTNATVIVTASKEGVELSSTAMGTDYSGDEEGRSYVFQMVKEYEMIDEVIDEAREVIQKLVAS